jgi:hypothetical protein
VTIKQMNFQNFVTGSLKNGKGRMVKMSEIFCKNCGKKIIHRNNVSFCCMACCISHNHKNQVWLNRKDYNGIGGYRKFKKNECEICGSKENLIVHHKDEDRANNNKNNLKTLCERCHKKGHKTFLNFKEAYKREFRNSKGRFGTDKPIGFFMCANCGKGTNKENPKQKYCSDCTIKLNTRHRKKNG